MSAKPCRVEGCPSDISKGARGYCSLHNSRLLRTGELGPVESLRPPRTVADRVYPRLLEDANGCWVWQGGLSGPGYGVVGVGPSVVLVHRWVYEDMVVNIPEGLIIDHTCLNRACANPEHLDVVTRAENNRRGGLSHGLRRVS